MSLELRGVGLKLGGAAILRDIDLRLATGEQAALIGPSGAGKSTLLLLANTGLRPDSGTARLLGDDPWRLPRRACAPCERASAASTKRRRCRRVSA